MTKRYTATWSLRAPVPLVLPCLLVLGIGSCGGPPGTTRPPARVLRPLPVEQLTAQGLTRTVRYYVPSRLSERPALIVALHGGGGDGERFRRLTNGAFEALAEQHGFVVAYPDALGQRWNGCRSRAPYRAALAGVDDGAFLRAVARRGAELAGGRTAGVFVVGYSNGGHLVFRMALETPAAFDAYAVIGANLPVREERTCRSSAEGVSMMLVNGTEDPINPWGGGTVRAPGGVELGSVLSGDATAAHFVDLAAASDPPETIRFEDRGPDDGTRVEARRWRGAGEEEVLWMIVHGAGHTLPHPEAAFPTSVTGRSSHDVDGAAEIWKFFARHRPAVGDPVDSQSRRNADARGQGPGRRLHRARLERGRTRCAGRTDGPGLHLPAGRTVPTRRHGDERVPR